MVVLTTPKLIMVEGLFKKGRVGKFLKNKLQGATINRDPRVPMFF